MIDELGKLVPKDSIITNDAGNFTSWMHHRFPFKSSMKLIGSEIGAMGMGIPAGIAASLRFPENCFFFSRRWWSINDWFRISYCSG